MARGLVSCAQPLHGEPYSLTLVGTPNFVLAIAGNVLDIKLVRIPILPIGSDLIFAWPIDCARGNQWRPESFPSRAQPRARNCECWCSRRAVTNQRAAIRILWTVAAMNPDALETRDVQDLRQEHVVAGMETETIRTRDDHRIATSRDRGHMRDLPLLDRNAGLFAHDIFERVSSGTCHRHKARRMSLPAVEGSDSKNSSI
jgi:hypothetical protein